MSSFLCSDKHLATIAIYSLDKRFTGVDTSSGGVEADKLLEALHHMNAAAVAARYGESVETYPEGYARKYLKSVILPMPSAAEMVKLIDCYLYQCTESHSIVASDLFICMKASADRIARTAIGSAYKTAKWEL